MKKLVCVIGCLIVALSISLVFAAQFKDQKDHTSCKYCGMDRTKFAHSRMLVEYQDGEQVGTCSLHCMTIELMESLGRESKTLQVADYNTHELINLDDAVWVIGGDKKGVMSMRAKWAFTTAEAADKFITEHGGTRVSADQALKASYDDMAKDKERMGKMKGMKKKK